MPYNTYPWVLKTHGFNERLVLVLKEKLLFSREKVLRLLKFFWGNNSSPFFSRMVRVTASNLYILILIQSLNTINKYHRYHRYHKPPQLLLLALLPQITALQFIGHSSFTVRIYTSCERLYFFRLFCSNWKKYLYLSLIWHESKGGMELFQNASLCQKYLLFHSLSLQILIAKNSNRQKCGLRVLSVVLAGRHPIKAFAMDGQLVLIFWFKMLLRKGIFSSTANENPPKCNFQN